MFKWKEFGPLGVNHSSVEAECKRKQILCHKSYLPYEKVGGRGGIYQVYEMHLKNGIFKGILGTFHSQANHNVTK